MDTIDQTLLRIGRRLKGTPIHPVAKTAYYKVINPARNFYVSRSLDRTACFTVRPSTDGVPEYELYLDLSSGNAYTRQRIHGTYEEEIMDFLVDHVDGESTFWEVGAGFGYFSLAMAPIADQVYSFEASEDRLSMLEKSVVENDYRNVSIVDGIVGDDVSLDDYETPDVVTMDIEGHEVGVLQSDSVSQTLESGAVWAVEVHWGERFPDGDPDAVESVFQTHGYDVRDLGGRDENNKHIVALPR